MIVTRVIAPALPAQPSPGAARLLRPATSAHLLAFAGAGAVVQTKPGVTYRNITFRSPVLPFAPQAAPALPAPSELVGLASQILSANGEPGIAHGADIVGLVLAGSEFRQEWQASEKKLSLPIISDAIGLASSLTSALCLVFPHAPGLGQAATVLKPIGAVLRVGQRFYAIYKGGEAQGQIQANLFAADLQDLGDSLKDTAALFRR